MAWDDFNLLAPPRQMQLLQRAINNKLGIVVTVDHGPMGATRSSIPYRVAIDQMLDAFHNISGMAAVLGLPEKAMSLNGTLSLELRKNAQFYGAFYPGQQKIALPGRSNSFAHEWGHALDYYLLGQLSTDEASGLTGLIRNDGTGSVGTPEIRERFVDLLNTMFFDKAELAAKLLALEAKAASTKSASIRQQTERQIQRIREGAGQHRAGRSNYYKGARQMDGPIGEPGGGYWQKPTEMLARAFEAYVAHKAEAAGMSTEVISHADGDYLSNADERLKLSFPKDDERQNIFDALDDLFDTLASRQTLGTGQAADIPENPERRPEPTRQQAGAFVNIVRNELGAVEDARRSREKAAGQPKDPKAWHQKANDVRHFWFSGMAAEMRALGRRHNSPAVLELHDLLVHEAGGARKQRRDLIAAHRIRADRYANQLERALKTLGPRRFARGLKAATTLSKEQAEDVRSAMVDEGHQMQFPELKPLASRLREISDGIWHDLRNAGFNIGYTRNGYLPRIYDRAKAEANQSGFIDAAMDLYGLMGMEEPEAREAAAEWFFRLTTKSPRSFDLHQPQGDYLKGRALPPEADTIMADFMATEPVDLLHRYADASAFRIEWAQRFGADNSKLHALYGKMAREGVDGRDVDTIQTMVDIVSGNNPMRGRNASINAAGAWVNTIYGTVALLPRAVIQSGLEAITSSIVLENPLHGIHGLVNCIEQAFGTRRARERRELVEFTGLVNVTSASRIMADRFGGAYDDPIGSQKVVQQLFHNTGLIALTRAQQTANVDVVNAYLANLSRKLTRAQPGSAAEREALSRMDELGIRDPKAFARWMNGKEPRLRLPRGMSAKLPTKAELKDGLDEHGPSPWAFDWLTAQRRLGARIIQDPHAMTKPMVSHAGNFGRFVTGIQAFNYSFYENVLKPIFKNLMERFKDRRFGMAAGGFGIAVVAFLELYAAGFAQTAFRVFTTDQQRWAQEKSNGTLGKYLAQRTATSFIGNPMDPEVQAVMGLKYHRPLGASIEGPALGNIAANLTDIGMAAATNSRKNNTAEFNTINGVYRLMSPFGAMAVGALPGGPIANAAYGVGQGYITSPRAGQDLAARIVGPKNGSPGPDGKKVKSGPTGFDKWADRAFGEVKRAKKSP